MCSGVERKIISSIGLLECNQAEISILHMAQYFAWPGFAYPWYSVGDW
jgi:hypothetical protein